MIPSASHHTPPQGEEKTRKTRGTRTFVHQVVPGQLELFLHQFLQVRPSLYSYRSPYCNCHSDHHHRPNQVPTQRSRRRRSRRRSREHYLERARSRLLQMYPDVGASVHEFA